MHLLGVPLKMIFSIVNLGSRKIKILLRCTQGWSIVTFYFIMNKISYAMYSTCVFFIHMVVSIKGHFNKFNAINISRRFNNTARKLLSKLPIPPYHTKVGDISGNCNSDHTTFHSFIKFLVKFKYVVL